MVSSPGELPGRMVPLLMRSSKTASVVRSMRPLPLIVPLLVRLTLLVLTVPLAPRSSVPLLVSVVPDSASTAPLPRLMLPVLFTFVALMLNVRRPGTVIAD